MSQLCDLHIHSHYSDGTCSPAELIRLAQEQDLKAVALCDHNTLEGLPEFLSAGEASPVEAVPGIEFSTEYEGTELHILGLYIRPEQYDRINGLLTIYQRKKEESNLALAKALNDAGYTLDYDAVKARTEGVPNRAHFAAELIEKGYLSSIREGCLTILSPKNGLYTPPPRPNAFETVAMIRSMGAVSILAHPFLNLKETDLRVFLQKAVPAGLDGMETLYATFDEDLTARARVIAGEFCLKESGGSDFHGSNKPDISIGTGRGNLAIPLAFLDTLKVIAKTRTL